MRQCAAGRHQGRQRTPILSYILTGLAILAAALTAAALAGVFTADAAVGTAKAPAIRVRAVADISARLDKAAIARLAALARARQAAAVLAEHTYTVRSGDSISAVALHRCNGQARDWTGIYAASRARGWTARNANSLDTGQHLYLACSYDPAQLKYAPAPPPPPAVHAVVSRAYHRAHAYYRRTHRRAYRQAASGTYHGSGSMQSCIISRESGGSSQVMNSTGHYGLYQFSAQTWAAHGGSPADFGHASVAEQNAVYYATVAADGYADWAPYDGC